MNLTRLFHREKKHTARLPAVDSPVCHLIGPGKLSVSQNQLCFWTDETRQLLIQTHALQTLLCHGQVSLTSDACHLLLEKQIPILFLDRPGGQIVGRLEPDATPHVLLRILQYYSLCRPNTRLTLARAHVQAKIQSQLAAARHYQRQGKDASPTLHALQRHLDSTDRCTDLEKLRGIEGAASAIWFALLARLVMPTWNFDHRRRRPPPDPVNALLSLGYTLLMNRVRLRLQADGYEPSLGALHEFRPGRPSLACDLMESLRVPVVDRWTLKLCNQNRVTPEDFIDDPKHPGGKILRAQVLPKTLLSFDQHWYDERFDLHLNQIMKNLRELLRKDMPAWPKLLYWLQRGYGENLVKPAERQRASASHEASGDDASDDFISVYRQNLADADPETPEPARGSDPLQANALANFCPEGILENGEATPPPAIQGH